MSDVKPRRRYDSRGRQAQAAQSRAAVLAAAERRFLDDGYARTTVAAIAEDAGVSVETVYKAFGGKSGLVRALHERALAGREPVPAYRRSDEMRDRESDPRAVFRNWGDLTAEVASTLAPIRTIIRAAAGTDADIAALLADSDAQRLLRMRHHATFLADRGYLRDGVTVELATDVLWTCSSAELYDLLVLQRGWSLAQFSEFVADLMASALLPSPGDPAPAGGAGLRESSGPTASAGDERQGRRGRRT